MRYKRRYKRMEDILAAEFRKAKKLFKKLETIRDYEEMMQRNIPKITDSPKTKPIFARMNLILANELEDREEINIEDLYFLIYCGAKAVVKICELEGIIIHPLEPPGAFPGSAEGQSKLFLMSNDLFCEKLFQQEKTNFSVIPSPEEIYEYWKNVWEIKRDPTENSQIFLRSEKERISDKGEVFMAQPVITVRDLLKVFRKLKQWANPGIDGLHIFWYRKFYSVHEVLVQKINDVINNPELLPPVFKQFPTILLPKNGSVSSASQHRSKSFVTSIYKIISKCICFKIQQHFDENGILADEQMGARRGYFGSRIPMIADSVALAQDEVWGAYLDYTKAYDNVSHAWIMEILKVYKVNDKILNYLANVMDSWQTRLFLKVEDRTVQTGFVKVNNGLCFGDPINALLYMTIINPFCFYLKNKNLGLKLRNGGQISHIFYLDDLKMYASSFQDLNGMIEIFLMYSGSVRMKLNMKKCRLFAITSQNVDFEELKLLRCTEEISFLPEEITFMGYKQSPKIDHSKAIAFKITKFFERVLLVLNTKITLQQKIHLINNYLFVVLVKSFGVLMFEEEDLSRLVCRLVNMLNVNLSYREILTPAKLGGLGLTDIHLKIVVIILKMRIYFYHKQVKSDLFKSVVLNDVDVTPLNLADKRIDFKTLAGTLYAIPEVWEV